MRENTDQKNSKLGHFIYLFIYLFIFNLFNADKLTYIFDIWR